MDYGIGCMESDSAKKVNTMTQETTVRIQTFFKIAEVEPLGDLKEEFLVQYGANDRDMLISAGLIQS